MDKGKITSIKQYGLNRRYCARDIEKRLFIQKPVELNTLQGYFFIGFCAITFPALFNKKYTQADCVGAGYFWKCIFQKDFRQCRARKRGFQMMDFGSVFETVNSESKERFDFYVIFYVFLPKTMRVEIRVCRHKYQQHRNKNGNCSSQQFFRFEKISPQIEAEKLFYFVREGQRGGELFG